MTEQLNDPEKIADALARLNHLQECILLYVVEAEYGTSWRFGFDLIWDERGRLRPDLGEVVVVELTFGLVQEMRYAVRLMPSMLQAPEQVNWGLREIARAMVVRDSSLLASYRDIPRQLAHVAFLWESQDARVDVVFAHLTVRRPFNAGTFEEWQKRMKSGWAVTK